MRYLILFNELDVRMLSVFNEAFPSFGCGDRGLFRFGQTTNRLQILREVYEVQAMLVAKVSKDVSRFRKDLEVVEDALEESKELTDVCRVCWYAAIRGCRHGDVLHRPLVMIFAPPVGFV